MLSESTDNLAHDTVAFDPRGELFMLQTAMHPGHGTIHTCSGDRRFANRRAGHGQIFLKIIAELLKHDPPKDCSGS